VYRKFAILCERLFSSASYIDNKTISSLAPNGVYCARLLALVVIRWHLS